MSVRLRGEVDGCHLIISSVVPFQDRLCWNLRHHVCGSAYQFIKGASLFRISFLI